MRDDDLELLRAYVIHGSETAFRTVVDRHLAQVYSSALRQVGNSHLAEEVTQAVFLILARKAASLRPTTVLTGWLFRTTRFASVSALRAARRRRHYEHQAAQMQPTTTAPAPDISWDEIAPLLDEAVAHLGAPDRHAILLRFFERKEHKEIGRALGASEEAAKKRVARALEKMRSFLGRRGVGLSVTALASAVMTHGVQAAPPALAQSIAAAVTADGGVTTATLPLIAQTMKAMFLSKLQTAAVTAAALLLAVGAGTFGVLKAADAKATRAEASARFDRATPLGALHDFADALEQSDSVRVRAAIDARKPDATNLVAALGEAVESERRFKEAVVGRFGRSGAALMRQVINLNFGQEAFKTAEDLNKAVAYSDADHAIVQLPSRSRPGKPHTLRMVRVGGVWKLSEAALLMVRSKPQRSSENSPRKWTRRPPRSTTESTSPSTKPPGRCEKACCRAGNSPSRVARAASPSGPGVTTAVQDAGARERGTESSGRFWSAASLLALCDGVKADNRRKGAFGVMAPRWESGRRLPQSKTLVRGKGALRVPAGFGVRPSSGALGWGGDGSQTKPCVWRDGAPGGKAVEDYRSPKRWREGRGAGSSARFCTARPSQSRSGQGWMAAGGLLFAEIGRGRPPAKTSQKTCCAAGSLCYPSPSVSPGLRQRTFLARPITDPDEGRD